MKRSHPLKIEIHDRDDGQLSIFVDKVELAAWGLGQADAEDLAFVLRDFLAIGKKQPKPPKVEPADMH
jgi:hypothetical protein